MTLLIRYSSADKRELGEKMKVCKSKKCGKEIQDDALFCPYCGRKQETSTPKKQRGNGQGTVYKLPNGKWRAEKTVSCVLIPGSEPPQYARRRITRSDFTKKSDAIAFLPLLGTVLDTRERTQQTVKQIDKTRTTLKELYDLWKPTHKKSKSTMNCYAAGFNVFKDVWDTAMKEQDIDDLQECIDSCEKGRRTKENAKAVLGLVYKYGIPRGYIPSNLSGRPNLAEFINLGAGEKSHKQGLSEEELQKLKDGIGTVPYADYVYCHCYLGFRPSAFIALDIADYNSVERAFVGGIKTEAGKGRTVTVSPKIQAIVDRLISGRSEGPVFSDQTGGQLTIRQYRAIFYDVLDATGIQPISDPPHRLTPHSCRHTFATLLKRASAPDKDKLELMGHTSTEMLRHYQDVNYDDLRKITDVL